MDLKREEVVFALDAIVDPVSLYEPVYSDGGDTICVMDQVKDQKNTDENWLEQIALKEAMDRLSDREKHILRLRFFEGKTQMEVAKEVIGSNEFAVALRTSNAKDFGLTLDYPYVGKVIALMDNDNLVERERGLDLIIWHFLDEAVTFDYFSLERVISYMLRLMIVERWSKMSSESGRKVFMEMVDRFRKSFQFEEQFK